MKQIFILALFILITHNVFSKQSYNMPWVDEYYSNRMSKYDVNLLIATSKGIIKYNDVNKEIYNVSENLGTCADEQIIMISVTPNNYILYTVAPSAEYLYYEDSKGVYIFDGEETKLYEAYFYGNLLSSLSCSYDKSNSLWITSRGNIFPANIDNIEYPFYYSVPDNMSSAVLCSITDTQFDSKDNLWIAIYGDYNHLLCLKKGESLISKILIGGEKNISSIAIDKNDNVWFAIEDGIHCYNQITGKDSIMTNVTNPNIPATQFYANDTDDIGNIWFSSSTTLMKYDGTDFTTYTCPDYNEARSILCDGDIVWILLKDDKLLKFQNNEFETIDLTPAVMGISETVIDANKTKAYIANGVLNIEKEEGITSVEVYNSLGTPLFRREAGGEDTSIQIPLPATLNGVIIVNVNNEVVKVICN
ncbi:MAG: hypothetical protein IKU59_06955 [Bacteroidales bacterium]|nr:hypothetical protein [Bacteroidales bacterium]